jgi:cephalosporin-C deacetylase
MWADLHGDALHAYRSAVTDPEDFDAFWASTLAETREHDLNLVITPVDTGLATVAVFDVSFAGFDGTPVRGWLRLPPGSNLPVVVEFIGYGGGRGHPLENLLWSSAGFAHFVMDTRGQGSGGSRGDTPDPVGSDPAVPGVMTKGIGDKETYYYRRLFADAVRAVEAARQVPEVDPTRVAVLGSSQGGGIALAVAGLVPDLSAVIPRVPFLCDFPRATVITDRNPYHEIARYLKTHRDAVDRVSTTLRYFDGVNFGRRATAPAWFSAALMDITCPPSTVFGAYQTYAGPKQIAVWPYNGHEGGEIEDDVIALAALRGVFTGGNG